MTFDAGQGSLGEAAALPNDDYWGAQAAVIGCGWRACLRTLLWLHGRMRDLSRLLQQPEGQYCDRKSLWHGPPDRRRPRDRRAVRDEIARYAAAFANADGGTLIMGAEDDDSVSGHSYPARAIEDMLLTPTQRLTPPQPPGELVPWQGLELLVFEVPAAERAVMVRGNGFPRRVHDEVVQESEEVINAIKARGRTESIELEPAAGIDLDSLDPELMGRAQKGAGFSQLDVAEYLCERRLADYRGRDLVLRKGAAFLFARRARDLEHPNAGVRILRVDGTERLTGMRHNVQELPRHEGALALVVEQAYQTISGLIRRSARLHDLFFREMPEYPTFAWQEALVNAVAHRDYRIHGRCVEVWLYEDRMEITSPGTVVPEVDLARLRSREPVHCSRNPRMTRVLAELGLMREQGEGLPRMFDEMAQSWLHLPELHADGHTFTVVLHNQPIFEVPDSDWVRHVRNLPLGHKQRRILVAYPGGCFANADYQRLNGVDRDESYRELKELVDLGFLAGPEGKGRGARYEVLRSGPGGTAQTLRPQQVLSLRMQERGFIKNADYREIFNVQRPEAKRVLAQMVASGVLAQEGERRGARYKPGTRWGVWLREQP